MPQRHPLLGLASNRAKNYPNIEGACNCWDVSAPTKEPPKPTRDASVPSTEEPPAPRPCTGGAAVCLDFEDVPLHERVGGIITTNTSMTVENTRAVSGKQAARILLQDKSPTNITQGVITSCTPAAGPCPPSRSRTFTAA